jgi:hypothetical protein
MVKAVQDRSSRSKKLTNVATRMKVATQPGLGQSSIRTAAPLQTNRQSVRRARWAGVALRLWKAV